MTLFYLILVPFLGDGVNVMTESLKSNTQPNFLTVICGCLYYVTLRNNEAKKMLLQGHGTEKMMMILVQETKKQNKHENLIENLLKVFMGLAASPENKNFINNNNGIELIISHLSLIRPDPKWNLISYYAASTVRNLSDSAKLIQDPKRLAEDMLKTLQQPTIHEEVCINFVQLTPLLRFYFAKKCCFLY